MGWTVLVLDTLWGWDGDTLDTGIASEANGAATLGLVHTDKTLSIRGTWILIETRINTVLVTTCLVSGTLRIRATTNHLTAREWISFIAGQTATVGPVTSWVAFSKPSTRVIEQTGVDTVSLDTGLSVPAVIVRLTTNGVTRDLGVANIARWTDTHWPVVLYEALSSGATVAGVLTLSVDTGLATGTVVISGTAWRVGKLHRLTSGVCLGDPALSAATDHGSEGQTVDHGAH